MSGDLERALRVRSRSGRDIQPAIFWEQARRAAAHRRRTRLATMSGAAAVVVALVVAGSIALTRSSGSDGVVEIPATCPQSTEPLVTPTTTAPPYTTVPTTTGSTPSAAPLGDGPILYSTQGSIWSVQPLDGIAAGTGPALHAVGGGCSCSAPSWSPDHRQIAFLNRGILSVMNADGTNIRGLGQPSVFRPTWSPDGTQLAFSRGTGNGGPLQVVNVDGTGLKTVVESAVGTASWSPDGREIVYDTIGEPHHIDVVDLAVGSIRHLTTEPGVEQYHPAWSYDGTAIVFATRNGIFAIRPDGNDLRPITPCDLPAGCGDYEPAWAPDGTHIVFARNTPADQGLRLWVVDVATGVINPLLAMDDGSSLPSW